MQNFYRVIIVGGGASGVFSALELTDGKNGFSGADILILEKNDRLLKKLVVTGNGQGNISNADISARNYYGDKEFINCFLSSLKTNDVSEYFYRLGIKTVTDGVGRIYPLSKQASAVSDILRAHLDKRGVNVKLNGSVTSVRKTGNLFTVKTNAETYSAENVILAVGGCVGKQFGTDGSSYVLAENFGHKKTDLFPSLVQIKTEREKIRGLKGLKEYVKVTAYDGETPLKSAVGDLLFTDYGVSGSAVFQVSGRVTDAKKPWLNIEFLPDLSEQEVLEILKNARQNSPVYNENALSGIINKRIGLAVIKTVKDKNIYSLASALKSFRLRVEGSAGFDNAQVTKGGISVSDITPTTFESRLVKNLYMAGEMLDVDGDCGGYNLTFAFVSGIICAKAIKTDKGE